MINSVFAEICVRLVAILSADIELIVSILAAGLNSNKKCANEEFVDITKEEHVMCKLRRLYEPWNIFHSKYIYQNDMHIKMCSYLTQ